MKGFVTGLFGAGKLGEMHAWVSIVPWYSSIFMDSSGLLFLALRNETAASQQQKAWDWSPRIFSPASFCEVRYRADLDPVLAQERTIVIC